MAVWSPVHQLVPNLPMAFMFEKLEVYQKAVSFADQVAALTQDFPRRYGFLVDQVNRAAPSIATNLAEGNGRFTKPDRKNFFRIARGSAKSAFLCSKFPASRVAKRIEAPSAATRVGNDCEDDQRLDQRHGQTECLDSRRPCPASSRPREAGAHELFIVAGEDVLVGKPPLAVSEPFWRLHYVWAWPDRDSRFGNRLGCGGRRRNRCLFEHAKQAAAAEPTFEILSQVWRGLARP